MRSHRKPGAAGRRQPGQSKGTPSLYSGRTTIFLGQPRPWPDIGAPAHFRALLDTAGELAVPVVQILPDAELGPARALLAESKWVLVIGDDPPAWLGRARGPRGFDARALEYALRRAGHVLFNVSSTAPAVYQAVARYAAVGHGIVLVETRAQELEAWRRFAELYVPPGGGAR